MKKTKVKKSTAVAVVETGPIAEQLTTQYRAVVAATGHMLRESVKFGAMLIELETIVGDPRGGAGGGAQGGLKTWLEDHCPEINYSTAINYKALATKAATLIGGTGLQTIAALQGSEKITKTNGEVIDVPATILKERDALFAEVDSRRKLEQAYFAFMAAEGGGRAKREARPLVKLSRQEAAKAIWNNVMVSLTKSSVRDAIPLLGEKETRVCHDSLRDIVALLKRHMEEF